MTDTQLDAMVEAANAQAWEDINRENPKAQKAASLLQQAIGFVAQAVAALGNAAETVNETPDGDRITSLANALEDLGCDIWKQLGRMK